MRSLHTPAYRAFVARLVAARESRRLTQTEVAKALHLRQSEVSRMERGETSVNVIQLAAFAKLYRKRISWFVPDSH